MRVVESGDATIAILADGAGGTGDGAAAADAAVERCASGAATALPASPQACVALLREADDVVLRNTQGGETTLVVAVIAQGMVYGASVGNSIAWIVRPDGEVLDLTLHQRRRPFVGNGAAQPIAFGPVPLSGSLVLASDGVHDYLPRAQLVEAALEASSAAAVETAFAQLGQRHRSLPDDASLLVFRGAVNRRASSSRRRPG